MRTGDWSSDVCSSDLRSHYCVGVRVAWEIRDDRSPAHDGDAVAHAEDLRQVAGDEEDGEALLRQAADDLVDFALGADVQDRKSVVLGKWGSVRVDLGGPRIIQKKK